MERKRGKSDPSKSSDENGKMIQDTKAIETPRITHHYNPMNIDLFRHSKTTAEKQ